MKRNMISGLLVIGMLFSLLLMNVYASEPDWSKVPEAYLVLFYPGQTSWEFATSQKHPGFIAVKENKLSCGDCHKRKEAQIAVSSLNSREPSVIIGKEPVKVVTVKAAYNEQYAYFWFQWVAREPGIHRKYLVYDGKEWKTEGGIDRPYNEKKGIPAMYEDRLSIMLDDEKIPTFTMSGCFVTCHNDMRKMPSEAKTEDVKAHSILGEKGMKKSDVRKYILESRTKSDETGGWAHVKTKEELGAMKKQSKFVDLLQWRASRGNPLGVLDDGYILEYRATDKDGKTFDENFDKEKKQPKYMFDEKKIGFKAFQFEQLKGQKYYYISKDISVPFKPDAGWKKGDTIPETIIFAPDDNTSSAHGEWKNGKWTVIIKRKLNHGNPAEDKILIPGKLYTVGIAVHEDNTTQRHHYVSLPMTLGFDNPRTDINIVEINK